MNKITDPLIIALCQQNNGPTAQYFTEQERRENLMNKYLDVTGQATMDIEMPSAADLISFYSIPNNTTTTFTTLVQTLSKFFSFSTSLDEWGNKVYVANKTQSSLTPVQTNTQSAYTGNDVYVAMPQTCGTVVWLKWKIGNTRYLNTIFPLIIEVDNVLENGTHPGLAANVDPVTFTNCLQALMVAAGWNEAAYTSNVWVQNAASLSTYFTNQLSALVQAQIVPTSWSQSSALSYFNNQVRDLTQAAYTEYWNGTAYQWLLYLPGYGSNAQIIFKGKVGVDGIFITTRIGVASGEITVDCDDTGAIFEPQSMGQFFQGISAARTQFLLDHSNGWI